MKRLNKLFVLLFILIGLLSIAYIWKSEADKKTLETTLNEKSQKISLLETKLLELKETKTNNEIGSVQGVTTTRIGTVSGKIQFTTSNFNPEITNTTIVCAQDKFTIREFCTDELLETTVPNHLQYSLEIPKGQYLIYAVTPPNDKKTYYSEVQKCTSGDNCENDRKILLEVVENETQKDINLYL